MQRETVVIKLGGSLLTDKSTPYKLRGEIIDSVAREIKSCIDLELIEKLVLIHGVGSFGHPPVLKYKLYEGFTDSSQLIHLSETQHVVGKLRNTIAEKFIDVGIPIVLMYTSSMVIGDKMKITEHAFKALQGFLSLGMVPLLGGDMMFDEYRGYSVCSGDLLAVLLSREIGADRLIFATDVAGVYDKDPKIDSNASLIPEININEIDQLMKQIEASNTDASGKMKGKLKSVIPAADLIKKGLDVSILSMMESNNLKRYLEGKRIQGTRIHAK
jgi:isopentenyl phosphate kinase